MKIAIATEDETRISQHLGRAPHFVVVTIEDGREVARERREKPAHGPGEQHHHGAEGHSGGEHGGLHNRMAAAVPDCQIVLAGGMGRPAYDSLQAAGLQPIVTDLRTVDEAVAAYLDGSLTNQAERLH